MAIRPEDEYTNITPASASYPGGSFKNETAPGNKDGTPYEKKWPDDIQGLLQKLLLIANITPSGTPDTVLASDYYDAIVAISGYDQVYGESGTANTYQLSLRSGASVEAYQKGQLITFLATNTNTGASTGEIDALGPKDITYPDGSPLLGGEILAGSFISLLRNDFNDRLELWVWVPAAYNSVMTGDETFIYSFQKERTSTLDAGALSRNFNPTGTFPNGAKEIVVNVGATDNVVFDSGDLGSIIAPGDNVSFIFNATSGSWEILRQPFVGTLGTFANNSNGNPNISDTILHVETDIVESTWESIGPTGSGADNIWTAMDVIPNGVDWIKIRAYGFSSISAGTPDQEYFMQVHARKTGGVQGISVTNAILLQRDVATAGGDAAVESIPAEFTISVDVNIRFDIHWTSDFTTFLNDLILIGWGYNA